MLVEIRKVVSMDVPLLTPYQIAVGWVEGVSQIFLHDDIHIDFSDDENAGIRKDAPDIREYREMVLRSEVKKKIPLRPETLRVLKRGMAEAVNRGTAQAAYSRKLNIAGKTGTAQNPQGQDHAWFVGFCPVDKPQLAFVVFVEHGGHGGVVCAPLIKKILTRYYGLEEEQRQINITEVAD